MGTGALLRRGPEKYTYNGIPMRSVPGTDDFVTVSGGSPSDFHLYGVTPDAGVVFYGESPYHGDFAATTVFAFDRSPATQLINSEGIILKIYGATCVPSIFARPVKAKPKPKPKKPAGDDPLRALRAAKPHSAAKPLPFKFEGGEHAWLGNAGVELACTELRARGIAISEDDFMALKRRQGLHRIASSMAVPPIASNESTKLKAFFTVSPFAPCAKDDGTRAPAWCGSASPAR